jgi:hypothetical protein
MIRFYVFNYYSSRCFLLHLRSVVFLFIAHLFIERHTKLSYLKVEYLHYTSYISILRACLECCFKNRSEPDIREHAGGLSVASVGP